MIDRENPQAVLAIFICHMKGKAVHYYLAIWRRQHAKQVGLPLNLPDALVQGLNELGTQFGFAAVMPAHSLIGFAEGAG
jgi:hypothetical protein